MKILRVFLLNGDIRKKEKINFYTFDRYIELVIYFCLLYSCQKFKYYFNVREITFICRLNCLRREK